MRVKSMTIFGHPGLGTFHLNFCNGDGGASPSVVIAGENGCGKTACLKTICHALGFGHWRSHDALRKAKWKYELIIETDNMLKEDLCVYIQNKSGKNFAAGQIPEEFSIISKFVLPQGDEMEGWIEFKIEKEDVKIYAYDFFSKFSRTVSYLYIPSEMSANFKNIDLSRVKSSMDRETEQGINYIDSDYLQGSMNITAQAEFIKSWISSLFIDDRNTVGLPTNEENFVETPTANKERVAQLAAAFNNFLWPKKFLGLQLRKGNPRGEGDGWLNCDLVFEEYGRRITMDQMSTGERNFLAKSTLLLRGLDKLSESILILDEPEIGFHPTWQERILPFFQSLTSDSENKVSQIIVATQSPFLVHGSPTSKHVVLKRNKENGFAAQLTHPTYPNVTPTDVAIETFDIKIFAENATRKPLVLLTEGETDADILKIAWQKIFAPRDLPYEIIGSSGAKNLYSLLRQENGKGSQLVRTLGRPDACIVGLFDFDKEGFNQWQGAISGGDIEVIDSDLFECAVKKRRDSNIWAILLPIPAFRNNYADLNDGENSILAIELLFRSPDIDKFLDRQVVRGTDPPIAKLVAPSQAKTKRALVKEIASYPPKAFEAFRPIFETLTSILTMNGAANRSAT